MARKVTKKQASRPEEGRDDLATMHPELTLTIADREITIREYSMVEGMRLRVQIKPFTEALGKLFERGEFLVEDVMDLVAEHFDLARIAIARSAGVDVEWIATLDDADGDLLLNAWWGVCGPFFVRPILRRLTERMRRAAAAGQTSTSTSAVPGSERPSNSGDTPSASSISSTAD